MACGHSAPAGGDGRPPRRSHGDAGDRALRLALLSFRRCLEEQRRGRPRSAARAALRTGRALLLFALLAPRPGRRR